MPGCLKVVIKSGRGLPIMDRRSELTDAFVELRFGGEFRKTPVCHRSLNPQWGDPPGSGVEFQFNFSEDDQLCEDLLLLRVMDHDTYSAHDAIGRVDINLSVFLFTNTSTTTPNSCSPNEISGFFPIFDTMHGIRGELELNVTVSLIPTTNDPTDVVFFASTSLPPTYKLITLFGLVDELVVNEDPEFQLIDKLRTSRTSNEVRVKVFSQLSAQVRRKLGLKALDLGANALLGYQQFFDIEGDTGVVVRGYGTAVFIVPENPSTGNKTFESSLNSSCGLASTVATASSGLAPVQHSLLLAGSSPDPASSMAQNFDEMISNKFAVVDGRQYKHVMVEYPFYTLETFEHGGNSGAVNKNSFIVSLGGLVCSRSVKLLDRIEDAEKNSLMRDNWWLELRNEVKSHMEAFSCNCIVGYSEFTNMYEDLIVLSAMGTAANIDAAFLPSKYNPTSSAKFQPPFLSAASFDHVSTTNLNEQMAPTVNIEQISPRSPAQSPGDITTLACHSPFSFSQNIPTNCCSLFHLPYNDLSLPFASDMPLCSLCKVAKVHEVLLCTCEPPVDVISTGPPVVIHCNVVKKKKRGHGETEAIELSGLLPFIEHEVQQQLLHKLQLVHMNSCWGLNITITVTQNAIIGLAVGTALHLVGLPFPHLVQLPLKYESGVDSELKSSIVVKRKQIIESINLNGGVSSSFPCANNINSSETAIPAEDIVEAIQESLPNIDLSLDGKQVQAFVAKPLDEPLLNNLYKSLLFNSFAQTKSTTLRTTVTEKRVVTTNMNESGSGGAVNSGGVVTEIESVKCRRSMMFNNLAIQVFHCDSYRNTVWNSSSFSETIDSALAKLNYKATKRTGLCRSSIRELVNVRIQLSGSDSLDDSAILCCTADICEECKMTTSSTAGIMGEQQESIERDGDREMDVDSIILSRCPIQITSLCKLDDDFTIEKYLGYINTFFIRETTDLKHFGSTATFVSCCLTEILTVLKATIANMGANALLSFKILYLDVYDNWNKNQAQTLLNVRGDVVKLLPTGSIHSHHTTNTATLH